MTDAGAWATISAGRNKGQGKCRAVPPFAVAKPLMMQTVTVTNDPVRLSFLRALLRDAGIECLVFDEFASLMDGSIGAVPRRLVVADADAARARLVLAEAGEG